MDTTRLNRLLPDFSFTPLAAALADALDGRDLSQGGGPWFVPMEVP
jgi:hypothetical protein